tara:strand:- start:335 stop:505 length:171 start_codon:yes stop_codon:yes gene_type:complete
VSKNSDSAIFAVPTMDFFAGGRLIEELFIGPDNISPGHSRFGVPSLKRIVHAASRQ